MRNKINSKLQISKSSWSPQKSHDEYVNYYSIPNFDLGFPKEEKTSEIKSGKFLINQPCILISKLNPGTPRVWLIQDLLPGVNVCSTEFVVLIPNEKLDLKYIYFILKSNTVTNKLTDMSTGTSNSHQRVRPESILELEVDWNENANERYVLSEFLWGLEQKISTNSALSKTLEDIAQTIFKSWFIDFDPVKAKMNGEKPIGMDDETTALFPDSFEESALGLIPKGWNATTLGEVCDIKQGKYLAPGQMSESPEGLDTVPVIGGNGILGFTSESTFNFDVPLVTCRGSRCGLLQWANYPSWVSNNAMAITMKSSSDFVLFLHLFLKQVSFENVITGSAQPQITITNLSYMKILVPDESILRIFTDITEEMRKSIIRNDLENQNLGEIRDSLLPRLISGELEIPEEMLAS